MCWRAQTRTLLMLASVSLPGTAWAKGCSKLASAGKVRNNPSLIFHIDQHTLVYSPFTDYCLFGIIICLQPSERLLPFALPVCIMARITDSSNNGLMITESMSRLIHNRGIKMNILQYSLSSMYHKYLNCKSLWFNQWLNWVATCKLALTFVITSQLVSPSALSRQVTESIGVQFYVALVFEKCKVWSAAYSDLSPFYFPLE